MAFDLTGLNIGLGLSARQTAALRKEERERNLAAMKDLILAIKEENKYQRGRRDKASDLTENRAYEKEQKRQEKVEKSYSDSGSELSRFARMTGDKAIGSDKGIAELLKGLTENRESAKQRGEPSDILSADVNSNQIADIYEIAQRGGDLRREAADTKAKAESDADIAKEGRVVSRAAAKEDRENKREDEAENSRRYYNLRTKQWNTLGNRMGAFERLLDNRDDPKAQKLLTSKRRLQYIEDKAEHERIEKELLGIPAGAKLNKALEGPNGEPVYELNGETYILQ